MSTTASTLTTSARMSQLSFLLCSTLCLVCILVSYRRIKRHRSRLYRLSINSHCAPVAPEEQNMASPDETAGGKRRQQEGHIAADIAHCRGAGHSRGEPHSPHSPNQTQRVQLPSSTPACDILQPLSHLAPIRASGHVAALVREAAGAGGKASPSPTSDPEGLPCGREEGAENHPPVPPRPPPPSPPPPQQQTSSDYRAGSVDLQRPCHPMENSSSSYPPASGHAYQDYRHYAADVVMGSGTSSPPAADEMQSVQKRSETALHCREVDTEGVRFWRRLIIEYS